VQALLETGKPIINLPATKARFRLYDQLFLDVLAHNRYPAPDLFANLFRQHAPATVLRFLDEDTHFGQELKIMAASPQKAFLTALAAKLRR
jgi:lycopene beta-cyclase